MPEFRQIRTGLDSASTSDNSQPALRTPPDTDTDTSLPEAVDNPGFAQIIGRHLELDPVAQVKPDKALSHLARNVGEYHLLIGKLYSKHCSRKNRDDFTFDWNGRLSGHGKLDLV
jgi:hypothetical protein